MDGDETAQVQQTDALSAKAIIVRRSAQPLTNSTLPKDSPERPGRVSLRRALSCRGLNDPRWKLARRANQPVPNARGPRLERIFYRGRERPRRRRGDAILASGHPGCPFVRRGASSFRPRNLEAHRPVANSPKLFDSDCGGCRTRCLRLASVAGCPE